MRVSDVFVIEDATEPGILPMKRKLGAGLKRVSDIIAVLFWFRNAGAAAVLELEKDLWSPGAEGLGDLEVELPDVAGGTEEVGFGFEQKIAGFYE